MKCVASPDDKLITSNHYLENHDEDDGDNENEDKHEVHDPHTIASWEILVLDDIQERIFLRKDIDNVKDRIYIKLVVSSPNIRIILKPVVTSWSLLKHTIKHETYQIERSNISMNEAKK